MSASASRFPFSSFSQLWGALGSDSANADAVNANSGTAPISHSDHDTYHSPSLPTAGFDGPGERDGGSIYAPSPRQPSHFPILANSDYPSYDVDHIANGGPQHPPLDLQYSGVAPYPQQNTLGSRYAHAFPLNLSLNFDYTPPHTDAHSQNLESIDTTYPLARTQTTGMDAGVGEGTLGRRAMGWVDGNRGEVGGSTVDTPSTHTGFPHDGDCTFANRSSGAESGLDSLHSNAMVHPDAQSHSNSVFPPNPFTSPATLSFVENLYPHATPTTTTSDNLCQTTTHPVSHPVVHPVAQPTASIDDSHQHAPEEDLRGRLAEIDARLLRAEREFLATVNAVLSLLLQGREAEVCLSCRARRSA